MKKLALVCMVLAMVMALALPAMAESTFMIDFEKPEIVGYKTISFEAGFDSKISIEPQAGFKGNVLKAAVTPKNASDTWWSTGLAFTADSSKAEQFKNLAKMTFKYQLTSDLSDTDVRIQLVWKDSAAKEVAKMEDVVLNLKKGDVMTASIAIPKAVADALNKAGDCHFDWFFIHFKDQAGESFKPGTIYVDDIAFFAEAPVAEGASSNPKTGDLSILTYALVALGSSGALVGLARKKKSK